MLIRRWGDLYEVLLRRGFENSRTRFTKFLKLGESDKTQYLMMFSKFVVEIVDFIFTGF